MKQLKFLLLAAIISVGSTAFAQKKKKTYTGGLRFGYNHSYIFNEGSMVNGTSSLDGFYVGTFGYSKFSERFWVGSGLEYVQNGYNGTNGMDPDKEHVKVKLHTISWPQMARFNLGPVFGLAGFAINIKVDETRWKADNTKYETTPDYDWFDTPVFLGLGVQFGVFIIEARYNWGIWDIDNGNGTRTHYGQVGAALAF